MDWDSIRSEWESSDITFKALAEKHNLKDATIRSRKNREKWQRNATQQNKNVATEKKRKQVPKKEEVKKPLPSDELTDKQRLFCIHYLKSFNATQSAIKAGYSPESAHVEGSRLLRNAKIGEYIRELKGHMTDSLFLDAMDVLQKYAAVAFADITDFTVFGKKEVQQMGMFGPLEDDDGNPVMKEINYVDFKESNAIDGTIVTEVKQGKDGVAIKLADKMKALDKLDKYFEMLPESTKHRLQEEKIKHDMVMKEKEVELKQQEIDKKNAQPDTPDITQYLEALKGEIKDVFDDE